MFGSKLFRQLFFTICLMVLLISAAFYLFAVPLIRETNHRQQEAAARALLDSVYDHVRAAHSSLEAYKRSALEAHKRELRHVVAIQEGYLRAQLARVRAGEVTEKRAQQQALNEMRGFLYGKKDYVWVSDYRSVLISHPDPKLHGADFARVTDIKGNLIVPPMVDVALKKNEGYTSYYWRRLGEKEPVEKLTYSRHFPEWKWVIGSGVYIDDIEHEVRQRFRGKVEELRRLLARLTIARSGYMFIFNDKQKMIIHPSKTLTGSNISKLIEPASGRPIGKELIASAHRADQALHYKWDRPSDPGHFVYDKISWTRYFPGFRWYISSSVYVDELTADAQRLRDRILLIAVVVLLLSVCAAYLLSSRLLRPIGQLSEVARRVQRGDLEARTELRRDDELGVLATAFDDMVARLRENISELDAKVNERTRELLASEYRAREASRAKSAFLAAMSHEIRTPMNAIIGMTDLLLDGSLSRQQREKVETIRASGDALLVTINDILDFSKIEAGRMELERVAVDPRECVESTLELLAPRAADKGIELVGVVRDTAPPSFFGDYTRLQQILINLVGNAIKFTEQGEVVVTVEAARLKDGAGVTHELRCSVRDTGIGISPARRKQLFEPFSQLDSSTARRFGGTGLGLAICRRLTELMGGRIWVESAPGEGSTFHFALEVLAGEPSAARERLLAQRPGLEGKGALVLVDNPLRREALEAHLSAWGMRPRAAASVEEALGWLRGGESFDVALVDGLTRARSVRTAGQSKMHVVLLSSPVKRSPDHDFPTVNKPVRASQLHDTLAELLGAEMLSSGEAPAALDREMGRRLPLSILVAEDNAFNQKLLLGMLDRLGYGADLAADGLEALAAVEAQRYDLVLMDVQMPNMDGLEATRKLRARHGEGGPRVVAVTANAMKEDRDACLAAGMDDYIGKPIRMSDLVAALQGCADGVTRAPPSPEAEGDAPAEDDAPVLDPAALDQLLEMGGGDASFLAGLVETFLEHAPTLMEELRGAVERGDVEAFTRAAHTMKSNCATFGAEALRRRSLALEQMGRDGRLPDAGEVDEVAAQLAQVTEALAREQRA